MGESGRNPSAAFGWLRTRLLARIHDEYGWHMPEALILFGTASLVGVATGFGSVTFLWLLGHIQSWTLSLEATLGTVSGRFLAMATAGLIVGLVSHVWSREARGHGVPDVMEAVALRGGQMRSRVTTLKVLAATLTLGAGGSAGWKGPMVQLGSAFGSGVGQILRFGSERVRTLVACGAAAGIAATLNAPIAGAIFAQEVILNNFTARYFGMVVISGVAASIVSRSFLGDQPAFAVPAYPLNHPAELGVYIVLGLLAAVVSVVFIHIFYRAEELFDGWPVPLYLRTVTGMLLTAALALPLPRWQVLGPGLPLIGETIAEDFNVSLGLMAGLLVLKLLATSSTLGSGNSGGVFAPSLFMGAILGGIVGRIAHNLWPGIVLHPGAYAIVGMAALFAGVVRAPITAVLIIFEMSGDYKLILPLMLATVISTLFAESLLRESIYTRKLRLRGVHLQGGRDVDIMQSVSVGEVMAQNYRTISADATLTELSDLFSQSRSHGILALDESGQLWGVVTITDLDRAVSDGLSRETTVARIGTPFERLVLAFPDETMGEAMARMSVRGFGRLPVVARDNQRRVVGLIRRADIIKAYNVGMARRAELQHRAQRAQVRNLDGTQFIDVKLTIGDGAIGCSIQEISRQLPHEAILISIRRDGKVLIPHGTTRFAEGDLVTAFIRSADVEKLHRCLHMANTQERGEVTET